MTLRVVTAPPEALLTADELRLYCRLQGITDFDAELSAFLSAATSQLEAATQRRFLTTDLELSLPTWPGREIRLPVAPVAANGVSEVVYIDANGDEQTLAPNLYVVSPCGPTVSIRPLSTEPWPILDPDAAEPVIIRFTAGEALAAVSRVVLTAAGLLVAHLYERRGADGSPALAASHLPHDVEALIGPERWD